MGAVRDIYFKLLKATKCKNCGNKLCKKVTICESGHTVCEPCYKSLQVCSQCKGDFFDRYHVTYNNIMAALNDKTNFLEKIVDILECPVCYEHLTCPSWTCWNGHLTCGRCYFYTSSCPLCREEFTNLYNADINLLLTILDTPIDCVNRANGCDHRDKFVRLRKHEMTCRLKQFKCRIINCEWRGILSRISSHVASKHSKEIMKSTSSVHIEISSDHSSKLLTGAENYWLEYKLCPEGILILLIFIGFNPKFKEVIIKINNKPNKIPVFSLKDSKPHFIITCNTERRIVGKTMSGCLYLNNDSSNWLVNTVFLAALAANLTFALIIYEKNLR